MKKKNDELIKKNALLYQKIYKGLTEVITSKNKFLGIIFLMLYIQQAHYRVVRLLSQYSKIAVLFLISSLTVANISEAATAGPSGSYARGSGVVWQGPLDALINVNLNGYQRIPASVIHAEYFAITSSSGEPCIPLSYSSDGGAYGIKIAEDVIFAISGTITGNLYLYTSPQNRFMEWMGTGYFSRTGRPSFAAGGHAYSIAPCDWNVGINRTEDVGGQNQPAMAEITNGTGYLYIGPNAKAGIFSFPEIYFMKGYFHTNNDYRYATQTLVSSSTFKISTLSCSVSAPPAINFGTVNLWNFAGNTTGSPGGARKDVLNSVDGSLSIICESDSPGATAAATLTLMGTPPVQGVTNDLDVTMDNSGNPAPATIRASIKDIKSPCAAGGTLFKGAGSTIDINQLSIGQNSIPYRFSLCSRPEVGINQFGSASAQATIRLDWE